MASVKDWLPNLQPTIDWDQVNSVTKNIGDRAHDFEKLNLLDKLKQAETERNLAKVTEMSQMPEYKNRTVDVDNVRIGAPPPNPYAEMGVWKEKADYTAKLNKDKPKELPTEAKNKIGYYDAVIKSLDDYEKAWKEGHRPSMLTPGKGLGFLTKATPLSIAVEQGKENYGRAQSGGAINKDESENFGRRYPTVAESKDEKIAFAKIKQLRDEALAKRALLMNGTSESVSMPARETSGDELDSMDDAALLKEAAKHGIK